MRIIFVEVSAGVNEIINVMEVTDELTVGKLSFITIQDTVTGFLLAGIGEKRSDGTNFLVVDSSTFYMPVCTPYY